MDSSSDGGACVPPLIRITTPTIDIAVHKSVTTPTSIHVLQSIDDTGHNIDVSELSSTELRRQSSNTLPTPLSPPRRESKPSLSSFDTLTPIHRKNVSAAPPPIPSNMRMSLPNTPLNHRHSPSVPPPLPTRLSVGNTPLHSITEYQWPEIAQLNVNIVYDNINDTIAVDITLNNTTQREPLAHISIPTTDNTDTSNLPATPTSIALETATQQPLSFDTEPPTPNNDTLSSSQSELSAADKIIKRRGLIISEILTTEQSYVNSIKLLMNVYLQPLNEKTVISKENVQILNSNLAIIADVNERFVNDLQQTVEQLKQYNERTATALNNTTETADTTDTTTESPSVASLFLKYAPFFKVYTQYVNDQERVLTLLQQLDKDNKWSKYIKEQQDTYNTIQQANALSNLSDSTQSLTLQNNNIQQLGSIQSYLIMPIQRIPRYKLLLIELQKSTDGSSTEYERLSKALSLIDNVATHINEAVRKQQQNMTVIDIQSKFSGNVNFVQPGRSLIKQGQLLKKGKKRDDKYQFFLFSDLLAYASIMITGKYKLHKELNLYDNALCVTCSDIPDTENDKYMFCVNNSVKPLILCAATQQLKTEWLTELNKLLHAVQNSGIVRPVPTLKSTAVALLGQIKPKYTPYSTECKCQLCQTKCTSTTGRHHCQCCGCVVCDTCSTNKVELQWSHRIGRVCDTCFDKLCELKTNTIQRLQRSMTMDSLHINEPRSPLSPHPLVTTKTQKQHKILPPAPKHLQQQYSVSVSGNSTLVSSVDAPLSPPSLLSSPTKSTPSRPAKPAQHTYFQMLSELVTLTPRIHAINSKNRNNHPDTKHAYSHTTFIGNSNGTTRQPQKLAFLQRKPLNVDTSTATTSIDNERSPSSLEVYENDSDVEHELADSSDDEDTAPSVNSSRRPSVTSPTLKGLLGNSRPNSGNNNTTQAQSKQIDDMIEALSPVSITTSEPTSPPPLPTTLTIPTHRSTHSVLPPPLPSNLLSANSNYDMTASMNGKRGGSKVAALTLKLHNQLNLDDVQSHSRQPSTYNTMGNTSRRPSIGISINSLHINGTGKHHATLSQSPPPIPNLKIPPNTRSTNTSPNIDDSSTSDGARSDRSRRSTGLLGKFNTLFTSKKDKDSNTLSQSFEVQSPITAPATQDDGTASRKAMANTLAEALKQRRSSHDNT